MNLGGTAPLDEPFMGELKGFLDAHRARCYSEHLSFSADDGHLYDLLPIPFTEEAVRHVAARIRRTQDLLGRRIAVENVSYYAAPGQELTELDFILAVLDEADCELLLDLNNVHVNAVNHGYDGVEFVDALPRARIAYCQVAGHYEEAPDLLVDTHGCAVSAPVWGLLRHTYARLGIRPTVLERDFNFPPLEALLSELRVISEVQAPFLDGPSSGRAYDG